MRLRVYDAALAKWNHNERRTQMKLWKNTADEKVLLAMLCLASALAFAGCKAGSDSAGTSAPAGAAADTNSVATNAPATAPATNASAPAEPAAPAPETAANPSTGGTAGTSGSQ
jgi:hypothetical protein